MRSWRYGRAVTIEDSLARVRLLLGMEECCVVTSSGFRKGQTLSGTKSSKTVGRVGSVQWTTQCSSYLGQLQRTHPAFYVMMHMSPCYTGSIQRSRQKKGRGQGAVSPLFVSSRLVGVPQRSVNPTQPGLRTEVVAGPAFDELTFRASGIENSTRM